MITPIPIVAIKDGRIYPFLSAHDAERKLKSKGFKICERNIRHCLRGERKSLCGFHWYYADDVEKYCHFIC